MFRGGPKEYGGTGFTEMEQSILDEEQGRFGITWPDFLLGLHLVAPSLMMFGPKNRKSDGFRPLPKEKTFVLKPLQSPMPVAMRPISAAERKRTEIIYV